MPDSTLFLLGVFFPFLNKLDLFISLTFVQFAVHLTRHLVGAYDDLVINCIIFILLLLLLRVVDRILDYCPVPLLFSFAMCVCVCHVALHPSIHLVAEGGWMRGKESRKEYRYTKKEE
jgi:hypothetical protein